MLDDLQKNNQWPQFGEVITADHQVTVAMTIDPEITWFAGHFPEQPVLPGVVQVDWAAQLSRRFFPELQRFRGLKNIKFKTVILPGATVHLALTANREKQSVSFAYRDNETVYSSGVLAFCPQ